MPSTSQKEHNYMELIAHNPAAAKRDGVPQSVGEDFVAADKASGKFRGKRSALNKMYPPGGNT